jgi:drug/metabolite transporter (DMT)-like permease
MKLITSHDIELRASLAVAYSGIAWGLFWIPLRAMDRAGVTDAWASVVFYGVPFVLSVPWIIKNWSRIWKSGWSLHLIGIVTGVSLAFYADAMLYTEVVRGLVLYYLTPIWSMILARLFLGEAITPPRVVAIGLGIAGMLVMFGVDVGMPLPRNIGDWMALFAGLGWAVGAVLLRKDDGSRSMEITAVYFFYCMLAAFVLALSPLAGEIDPPNWASIIEVLPWSIPIAILVIPAAYAVFWGAPHLNPGVVGLLMMTEISVGVVTAAVWANEPFGMRELTGVVLITLAGLSEFIYAPIRRALISSR